MNLQQFVARSIEKTWFVLQTRAELLAQQSQKSLHALQTRDFWNFDVEKVS
jgi:hypothetical protein